MRTKEETFVEPPQSRVSWKKTFRLIPSRYPPVHLFERIAEPADWEALAELEGMTNDRLRDAHGDIGLVPVADRISGPGASPIMAAFTHVGRPSRFTEGAYGVYYASKQCEVALAEVAFHLARFYAATNEEPVRAELRCYIGAIDRVLHDVRDGWDDIHDPHSNAAAQRLGKQLRARGSDGVVYRSVRSVGGENIAVFRASAVARKAKPHVLQGPHYWLQWDGRRISQYLEVGTESWRALAPPT